MNGTLNRPTPSIELIERLLSVIENDILPLTQEGVAAGNKLFGAALLYKSDNSLLLAETNDEMQSPLLHGEMHALKRYHEIDADTRPAPEELLFLSTHEPCSLCLSAITWAGFDNFFYLFSHENSRDAFAIPHDLKILKEVFNVDPGGYNRKNAFWDSYGLQELVEALPEPERAVQQRVIAGINDSYNTLSGSYQLNKSENSIPLN